MQLKKIIGNARMVPIQDTDFPQWMKEMGYDKVYPTVKTIKDARGLGIKPYRNEADLYIQDDIVNTSEFNISLSMCCGARVMDWSQGKIPRLVHPTTLQSLYFEDAKAFVSSEHASRGIVMHMNKPSNSPIPDEYEDERDVFSTFTFPDGEKVTFQFLKASV